MQVYKNCWGVIGHNDTFYICQTHIEIQRLLANCVIALCTSTLVFVVFRLVRATHKQMCQCTLLTYR